MENPLVGVIMGSKSDWETMRYTVDTLNALGVPHESRIVSAHRTPDLLFEYAESAEQRGIEVIIAGAGGAAHLPGMTAAKTTLPVLGVPVESKSLQGIDSLLSIVQMPAGVPVGTLAIGKPGAINAALLAASIVAVNHPEIRERLRAFRAEHTTVRGQIRRGKGEDLSAARSARDRPGSPARKAAFPRAGNSDACLFFRRFVARSSLGHRGDRTASRSEDAAAGIRRQGSTRY